MLQICKKIVVPNVRLSEEDEELFEMNYVEFIRRDMEGRRRIACELLKGFATNYKERVAGILYGQIRDFLSLSDLNAAANWKDMDCAIYLFVSLKAPGSTNLINFGFQSFFRKVIVPVLEQSDAWNKFPMLKAGALKFLTVFRNQIAKADALELFPHLVRFVLYDSIAVNSYAASCIEKLFFVKDEGGRARYTSAELGPDLLKRLMDAILSVLREITMDTILYVWKDSQYIDKWKDNQYVMKCIMRVLWVADIPGGI